MYTLDKNGKRVSFESPKLENNVVENFAFKSESTSNKIMLYAALVIALCVAVGGSYMIYRHVKSSKKETFGYRLGSRSRYN